jgi:hypothetical protein
LRTGKKFRSDRALAIAAGLVLAACVDNAPHLDSVTPTTVSVGQQFTLVGERFCQQAGTNTDGTCMGAIPGEVDFSVDQPTPATMVTTWTDTMVIATVPTRAPSGQTEIYLTSSGKASNALNITVQ